MSFSRSRFRRVWESRSPLILLAIKSALAAGCSWEIASSLIGELTAAVAVVSSVMVVQVTSWQTVRKSLEGILGVIISVSLAVLVGHFLGLTLWTITLLIFSAQILALFLQKRGQYLATQIPSSAALVLVFGVVAGTYPLLRLLGVLIGSLIGTLVSLFLSPPLYIFRARDAVAELTTQLTDALPKLAEALTVHRSEADSRDIATQIQKLEEQENTAEQAYTLGMENARLNPWAHRARRLLVDYPKILLALHRLVRQMCRIASTIKESESSWAEIVQKQPWATDAAWLLEEMASVLTSALAYVRAPATVQSGELSQREALRTRIENAQQRLRLSQTQLAQDAKPSERQAENAGSSSLNAGYRLALRGAILTDLRRMLEEVQEIFEMVSQSSHTKSV